MEARLSLEVQWYFMNWRRHKEVHMSSHPLTPLHIGVINPYVLAQIKVGHVIQWNTVPNPRALLEQILGHPYERLFDPKYDSPLYAGLKYDAVNKAMIRDETDP